MKKITHLTLLLFVITMQGQNFEWLKTTEPTAANIYNTSFTSACDPSGNIYTTGFKDTPFYYNTIMGNVYFTKYDTNGNVIFTKTFTGKCAIEATATDSQGNVILAMSMYESITIEGNAISSAGNDDEFIMVKLDSNGEMLWYKRMTTDQTDANYVEDFRAIVIDANDNIYAGYDNFMYSYITKYSPSGDKLLTIEQQNVSRVTSVDLDEEGNIYVAGGCAKPDARFAGIDAPTNFDYNTYVAKYSASGIFQWVKYIDDITCSNAPAVAVYSPDEIYFSSYLFTDGGFDDIEIEGQLGLSSDIFIARLNASGSFLWVREASESEPATINAVGIGSSNYLNFDEEGNLYFVGNTSGTVNWGNGITTTATSLFSDTDGVIVKYSTEGDVLYAKTVGGASTDQIAGITVDGSGHVFISGIATGNVNFGVIEHENTNTSPYSFLAKMNEDTMGIENPEYKTVLLYPNPSSDQIMITGIENNVSGTIINTLGQKVKDFEIVASTPLSISSLAQGTYFIKIEGYKPLIFIKQ